MNWFDELFKSYQFDNTKTVKLNNGQDIFIFNFEEKCYTHIVADPSEELSEVTIFCFSLEEILGFYALLTMQLN